MFKNAGLILSFLLFCIKAEAQYFNSGQNPASIHWRQIQSEHFKLIYPEIYEIKAQSLSKTFEDAYQKTTQSLHHFPKTIPVVINAYNTESNAITSWAPRRIEIYTCPPQDSYAQDWLTQLAIHEYRHVVQIDKTNQGFTKIMSWVFGEQAVAAISGIYIPSWFLEGDAVCAETAFSRVGRGRLPSFEMPVRAQVMQQGILSYSKATLGSYRTRIPNQYEMGYLLVASTRQKYGLDAWNSALNKVGKRPFTLTPFNSGIKKVTGKSKEKLYKNTFEDLQLKWQLQDSTTYKSPYEIVSLKTAKFENYTSPVYFSDSVIIVQHSSPDFIARFELLKPNTIAEQIATPGYLNSELFTFAKVDSNIPTNSYSDNYNSQNNNFILCWSEILPDKRWEMRNYSDIIFFETETKKIKQLTHKQRYFSPAISPSANLICAVKITPLNKSSIVLLDSKNGKAIKTLIESDNDNFLTPRWNNESEKIIYTRLSSEGKSIEEMNLNTGKIEQMLAPTFIEVSNPSYASGYILFNGSYSGIENIYAIDTASKEIFQVTSAKFGARNAAISPDGKRIAYSDYDASGLRIAEADFTPANWKALQTLIPHNFSLSDYLSIAENQLIKTHKSDTNAIYKSEPYKKGHHLFNFHSWAPAYFNYASGDYGTGVTLLSQNELNTATTLIGYKYDLAEQAGKAVMDFSWNGWYPKIDLNTSTGKRSAYSQTDPTYKYTFNETIISLGASVPFLFSRNKYQNFIQLGVSESFYSISNSTSKESKKLIGTIQSLNYQAIAYRLCKQATKDMYPRWGQVLLANFKHTPFGDNNLGNIFSVEARSFYPGLTKNHGIRLDLRYQIKNAGDYYYTNLINMPRGYLAQNYSEMAIAALNYKFPLAYPDLEMGRFLYFKRLKTNLFVDYGFGNLKSETEKLLSYGFEFSTDVHILRFIFPFDLGYRIGYKPYDERLFVDLLFSLNLPN